MNILSKNIFALLILQGSNYIIPLVTFPYLAKILQVESFGYYGLIFAITQYLVLFIDFGYNLSASKRIVEAKNNNIKISKIFFQTIIAKSILSLFVLLLVFLYHFLSESHLSNLIIFSSFQIIGTVLFPIWFFQGIEKMKLITVASISGKLLTLPWIFVFVKNSEDLDIAIFLQSISYFTTGIISLILIYSYKIISLVKVSFCDIKKSYLDSYQIYIAGLAISLYSISTPIIIKTFSSIEQVGFFTGADKLKSAGLGIFLIMGHALYPRVNNLFSESRVKAFAFVRKIIFISRLDYYFCIDFGLYLCRRNNKVNSR
ncbi:oligosaccharide flippase family protein [Shewanella marina]|uniref:oligosaccharide flippase family protein n=1 Tax=Shewanella marina TaxID=487319 RepID=UPI0006862010|nr:oligosaccharide flippase family protein [Shewanella marina]